ncbi:MAG: hypothetical protein Q9208_003442 [Pyrenodesmia sp. 3 TL-2023]
MAPHRTFSFPLSHTEETSRIAPFAVSKKDVSKLRSCEAFQIIRGLLVQQENQSFCDLHCNDCDEDKQAWLLQRDITHALILPVLEIHRHAARLANTLLGSRHIFDLELVFRGDARGAFSWLQCFVVEEEDWCLTKGCPEPTIRMILVACQLSSSVRQSNNASHLPIFDFWSHVMKKTLDEDPFWGPALWEDFESRATALKKGIEELVAQCMVLAPLAASAAEADDSPPTSPDCTFRKPLHTSFQEPWHCIPGIVSGCWTTLLADAAEAKRVGSSPGSPSFPVLVRSSTTS